MSDRDLEIEKLRAAMGTLPAKKPVREDKIYYGLSHLRVELVDWPTNPYKAIYTMVTSTWGSRADWWDRWENASPDGRLEVVKAALSGQTLPAALEAPSFTFKIQGLSRAAFDQLARHRASAISSVGSRDNNHADAAVVLSSHHEAADQWNRTWWQLTKDAYCGILDEEMKTWQTAREILPISQEWRFSWAMNYRALQDICKQRLVFCEQWDTVGTVWEMRGEVAKKFPLLAAYLRPRCDFAKRCTYSEVYTLSEMFGALFAPCGRNPTKSGGDKVYSTFNEACTSADELETDLDVVIPSPGEWDRIVGLAEKVDRRYFEC